MKLRHFVGTEKDLPNLKRLDLSDSRKLIRVPDLSQSPNIEEIILNGCVKLAHVYSSSFLNKLSCLCLHRCVELTSLNLPSNILSGSSGLVVLHGCRKLDTFSIGSRTEVVRSYVRSYCDGFWDVIETFAAEDMIEDMNEDVGAFDGYMIGEYPSDTFDPIVSADRIEKEEPVDNMHLLNLRAMIGSAMVHTLCTSVLNELCWLDISDCESLTSLPTELFKLKFLRRLYLGGSNLEEFPEIEETMENLTVLILDKTAIKELPSSLDRLVGLEELSLHNCSRVEIIPSAIASLSKLCKLDLTCCESLETLPSSIFKLRLTKLDLHGCSMLRTFPQILEPAESYAHVNLTRTAIEELPSSLEYLVGLQTLRLNLCSDLVSLPNSIVNLNLLSFLDCSGCSRLTEIPNDIGRLSSLRELSLQESSIVNLPESIAHLSSLKSLDLSDCKRLECIPQLPPFLEQLLAFDCPSIRRVMSNSRFDSKEGTFNFKFHFTNGQELDASGQSNLAAYARMRILQDAYRSVFFCFPGSAVPRWFPYRCRGHSVTAKVDSPDWFNNGNRLVGFALCVVLGHVGVDDTEEARGGGSLRFRLTFKSYGRTHILANHDELRNYFYWKGQDRFVVQDHTFIWKYHLDFASIDYRWLSRAHSFTFKISEDDGHRRFGSTSTVVKQCGICPLYTEETVIMVVMV